MGSDKQGGNRDSGARSGPEGRAASRRPMPVVAIPGMVKVLAPMLVATGIVAAAPAPIHGQRPPPPALGPVTVVSGDLPEVDHAEPHLAIDPTDEDGILVGTIELRDGDQYRVGVLYSRDGGKSFVRHTAPDLELATGADPWVAFDAEGRPFITALVNPPEAGIGDPALVWLLRADSLGGAWREPLEIGRGEGGGWDQQKISVDRTSGPYRGRIYVVGDKWSPRTPEGTSASGVGVTFSADGGRSVARIDHVEAGNTNKSPTAPVILGDGTVLVGFHEYLSLGGGSGGWLGNLWLVRSEDGADSWSNRDFIAKGLGPGMVALAADVSEDREEQIYAAWAVAGSGVVVATSVDRGRRWALPVRVGELAEGQAPALSLAVDGTGAAAILWTRPAAEAGARCYESHVALSTDRGASFSEPISLTDGPYCLPDGGPTFYSGVNQARAFDRYGRGGEYFGLEGFAGGGFYAIWVDGSTGRLRLLGREIGRE